MTSATPMSSPWKIPLLRTAAEIEDGACEGSLTAIHCTHRMAGAEPRPPAEDNISVGPRTEQVHYGKEPVQLTVSPSVPRTAAWGEAKNQKTIVVCRQPGAEAQLPQEWRLRLRLREKDKPSSLWKPRSSHSSWSWSQPLIPMTSHARPGPLPFLPLLWWLSPVGTECMLLPAHMPACLQKMQLALHFPLSGITVQEVLPHVVSM